MRFTDYDDDALIEESSPHDDDNNALMQFENEIASKNKKLSRHAFTQQMEDTFAENELFKDILEEFRNYTEYQILPIGQTLNKEQIESLLNAMRRK